MTLSEELQWRGMVKDRTFADLTWLDTPQTFYLGVDCSADSLTIGNLAVFMMARHLVDHGWKAVLLVGGATSLIGDPGGKDEERALKSRDEIASNVEAIKAQVSKLFAGKEFTPADNYDWFKDINYLEFLREVGKTYSMTELIQRDFIAERLGEGGSGISYAEFSYTLIQGYDFYRLQQDHGVIMQIGGSDQWGNMLSGVPLIRKKAGVEAHAMSMPLVINKATGKKFGKSEDGAVWLDANKTSVYTFYQFWLNADDEGVADYLKYYTLLPKEEIVRLLEEQRTNAAARPAQKALAYEVTKLVHGEEATNAVIRVTETLFGNGDYHTLSGEDFAMLKEQLPVTQASVGQTSLVDSLVATGLASSNTEARQFLSSSAIYINGQQFSMDKTSFGPEDVINGHAVVRRGKNQNAVVEFSN